MTSIYRRGISATTSLTRRTEFFDQRGPIAPYACVSPRPSEDLEGCVFAPDVREAMNLNEAVYVSNMPKMRRVRKVH